MKKELENLDFQQQGMCEEVACPICETKQFRTIVVEFAFPVVQCKRCKLTFVNPRPTEQALRAYYDNYFPEESEMLWQEQMERPFRKEGRDVLLRWRKTGRLLDVGCGIGFFVKMMAECGWNTQGVEISEKAARYAADTLHLKVFHGRLSEAPWPAESFDAVTFWYVLEHVPYPLQELTLASRLLKKGGRLILRVPNQNARIDRWLGRLGLKRFFLIRPPRHLFDYSPETMAKLLRKSGSSIDEVRNSIPRATGTALELVRRYLWYMGSKFLEKISLGQWITGSSITVYASKN